MLELDFESDPNDIRNPETLDDDPESSRQQTKVFEYRQSLRRYCSILFLTPKMKIFIRNNQVKNFFIKEALSRRQTMKYRPKGKNKTEITFGYTSRRTTGFLEDYGMMFYHRNRLIKPYVKLGLQTKTDDSCGEEVVGVVDFCDILQPTHNKQEFLVNTIEYRSAMTALGAKLNQYCSRTDHHGDTEDEDRNIRWTWVQCGRCRKWRRLPAFTNSEPVPNKWYCRMNPDLTKNRCDFPQELTDKEIDTPSITRRSRGIKSSAISSFDNSDCSNDASEQEPDCVLVTAAPPTPATTSKGPEVVSHRKRKQPAPQRTVGGKRARSIRDVMGQEHRVGVSDVPTAQQDRLLARHVTQALFTSSNDQGCNGEGSSDQGSNGQASISHHAPSVVTDDDPGVSGHDEDDDPGVIGHDEDDDPGVSGHDEDDDTGVSGHDEDDESGVTGHDEDDDTGVTGHDEDDDTGVNGHDEDDGTGVTEHDEDDDTGVTREQAAESNEQLRRFRGNVHTLLSFLVDLQLLDLPDVGPLEEIEDYVQRLLSSLNLPLE